MAKPSEPVSSTSGLDFIILAVVIAALAPIIGGLIIYIGDPINLLFRARDFFTPFFARNLWWLRILSVLLSGLFLWGIIHIVAKTNYLAIKAEQYINILGAGHLPRYRAVRGWRQILKRLASKDPQQWKIAVLEADKILDEILKMSGYLGSMDEKLDLLTSAQLSNIKEIKTAHKIRNLISVDPVFEFSQESAARALEIYKKAFIELNLISE